jgi:hypothetical protein
MARGFRDPSVGGMRKLGIGILGFFSGLLLGFLVTEMAARIAPGLLDSPAVGILLGYTTPALAVVGIFVALAIDSRVRS